MHIYIYLYTSTFQRVPSFHPKGWSIDSLFSEPFGTQTGRSEGIYIYVHTHGLLKLRYLNMVCHEFLHKEERQESLKEAETADTSSPLDVGQVCVVDEALGVGKIYMGHQGRRVYRS